MLKLVFSAPKVILIIIIKLIIMIFIFIALMSLFIIILKTGIIGEKSFGIKFIVAMPLAIFYAIISTIILLNLENSFPKLKRKKTNKIFSSASTTKLIEP